MSQSQGGQKYGPDLSVKLICPECQIPNPNVVEEFSSGDLVCGDCGLVLGDKVVDTRSEWRTFANDEGDDPSRVGAASNPLLDGVDEFETMISSRDGNSGISRELQRAAAKSSHGRSERSLMNAFRDISSMADQISLPRSIADIAKQLYKRVDEERLLRGKSTDAIIAACIFIACRQAGVPRTFKEVWGLTRVPKKVIGQCFKVLERAFGSNSPSMTPGVDTPTLNNVQSGPEDLMARYCNHLSLPVWLQSGAVDVAIAAREQGVLAGRSPITVAATCIYFASALFGHPKSASEIGNIAGVGDSTIKSAYKILFNEKAPVLASIHDKRANVSNLPEP
ncbi:hypothetical protein E3P99_01367 [Wallemia hederae]|uniref:Transcription initiation factor IIB n=1 Tax=Wallemia hederae TaxID=1540922 RepID=A0A4T0FQU0_9BASI|nr:hypothetical protein E3P99_01367 [Wallemia hederae]